MGTCKTNSCCSSSKNTFLLTQEVPSSRSVDFSNLKEFKYNSIVVNAANLLLSSEYNEVFLGGCKMITLIKKPTDGLNNENLLILVMYVFESVSP